MEPKQLSSGLELIPEMNMVDKERDALIISLLAQTMSQQDPNPSSFMLAYNELLKKGLIKNRDAMFWYNRAKSLFTSQHTILNDFQINMMKMRYERDFIPIEKLGRGGFGHVMKCRKKIDHRLYAVKIIPVKNTCKRITEQLKTTLREVISISMMDHKNVLRYYDAWIEPTWINKFTSSSVISNSNSNNNNISTFTMKRGREKKYLDVEDEDEDEKNKSKNNPMQIMNYPFNEDSEVLMKLDDDIEGLEGEFDDEEGEEEEDDDNNNGVDDDEDDNSKSKYNDSRIEVLSTDTQSTNTTITPTNRTTANVSTSDYMNNRMNDIIFEDSCSGSGNTTSSTSGNNNNYNNNNKDNSNSNNSVVFEEKKSYSKSNYGDDENDENEEERNVDFDENSKVDDNNKTEEEEEEEENDEDNDDDDDDDTSSTSSSSSGPPIEALKYKRNQKKENIVIDVESEKKNINENINTHKNPSPLIMPCDLVHFTNSKSPPFRQSDHSNGKRQDSNNNNNNYSPNNSSDIIPYKSPIYKLKFELSLYIQSEYCEGTTLGKYLSERMDKPNRKVNSIELYEFLIQIMEGLEHIHSKGIIHRDMKPENIFITNEKKIKIDSGIETSSDLSLVNPINNINSQHSYGLGTQLYASPEQLSQSDYDFSTDIYSVGLIIVEMFANFGSMMERALTLKDVRKSVMKIPKNVLSYKPFYMLLPRMLDHDHYNRPNATEILTTLKVYYHSFITPQLTKEVKMIENVKIEGEEGVIETRIEKEEEEIVVAVPNLLNIQKDINYDKCSKEELITLLVQRDLLIVEQQKRIFELEKKIKNKDK